MVDIVEHCVAAGAVLGGSDEYWRQFFPFLEHLPAICIDVALQCVGFEFVGFGEYDGERDAVFAEHTHEFLVDALWFMATVDEHEEQCKLLSMSDVVGDYALEFGACVAADFGIAVAGEVD